MTKVASRKQIDANRLNAQKSTGPRTPAGKALSRANACKHGLTAERVLLPGESAEAFEAFCSEIRAYLSPEGPLEEQLVERAVSLMWRLQRVPEFEAALFQWMEHYEHEKEVRHLPPDEFNPRSLSKKRSTRHFGEHVDADPDRPAQPGLRKLEVGRTLDGMFNAGFFDKLIRYDTALQRQMRETLKGLAELQEQRREREKLM
ncbi:MAG: hypothetical protein KKB37_11625 [Alphaproteobacteria bacterium]|nr:hypothetical protein [Alphaproteobacteria bacterium]